MNLNVRSLKNLTETFGFLFWGSDRGEDSNKSGKGEFPKRDVEGLGGSFDYKDQISIPNYSN